MKKYIQELEDLIMDVLLPSHIQYCRNMGIDPRTNDILSKLMEIRKNKRKLPYLLDYENLSSNSNK